MSDRKYRQRGYQDEDRTPSHDRRTASRPAASDGPKGRGLGRPSRTAFRCARCGQRQVLADLSRDAVCPECGTALHTCTHCASFDPSATHECRKPIETIVAKKAAANDCTLFEPKATQEIGGGDPVTAPTDPKAAFDALFKI